MTSTLPSRLKPRLTRNTRLRSSMLSYHNYVYVAHRLSNVFQLDILVDVEDTSCNGVAIQDQKCGASSTGPCAYPVRKSVSLLCGWNSVSWASIGCSYPYTVISRMPAGSLLQYVRDCRKQILDMRWVILNNCGRPGAITYGDNGLLAANSLAYVIGELYKRLCDECRASSTFSNATP